MWWDFIPDHSYETSPATKQKIVNKKGNTNRKSYKNRYGKNTNESEDLVFIFVGMFDSLFQKWSVCVCQIQHYYPIVMEGRRMHFHRAYSIGILVEAKKKSPTIMKILTSHFHLLLFPKHSWKVQTCYTQFKYSSWLWSYLHSLCCVNVVKIEKVSVYTDLFYFEG